MTGSELKICPQCGTEYGLDQRFCPSDGSTLRALNAAGDLVGSIIADRYHVLRKLGEGGMGTVYLAEHVKMGRQSAVKVMNPGMVHDADAISRFNREAANASRINHQNVAAVYDFGETSDGLIYLAMEFVEGPSLTRVIEEAGALAPLRAATIARQAADALSVAHDMGIVHRDLKPDNIMIARSRDGSDMVKVVDFGIAKAAGSEAQKVTKTGLVVGTPEYMSPEQLAGDTLDGRSDTYSLALVAFAMLTGKLPFPAETAQESMIARLTQQPKQLADMKPDVTWPADVQAVMDRALQREADGRYKSAMEFGSALYAAVERMPALAVTSGFTTVIEPAPGRPAAPTAPRRSQPAPIATPLPSTRVNPATPAAPQAAVASFAKRGSRAPVLAGIAALALASAGLAGYAALHGEPVTAARQQGDTAGSPAASLSQPQPTINLSRELERVSGMADEAQANQALVDLARLDSAARTAPDSLFLQLRFLRGRALLTAGQQRAGCDSLAAIEGKLRNTHSRFARSDSFLLAQLCTK